jgi:type II secretory pathway pseudopilin PulG
MKKLFAIICMAVLLAGAVPAIAGDSATQDLGFNVQSLAAIKTQLDEYNISMAGQEYFMLTTALNTGTRYGIFNNGATKKITATMTDGWTKRCRANGVPAGPTGQCWERFLTQAPTGATGVSNVYIEDGQTIDIITNIGLMDFGWNMDQTKRILYVYKLGPGMHTGGVVTQVGSIRYSILDQ